VLKSRLIPFVSVASSCLSWASSATEANVAATRHCGFVHASVPYSHHGHHDRWRHHVRGNASCAAARGVLNAVLPLNATAHYGSSNANSYFTYPGWTCDFGQIGFQRCWRPRHRPYQAGAVALDCMTESDGCPTRDTKQLLPVAVAGQSDSAARAGPVLGSGRMRKRVAGHEQPHRDDRNVAEALARCVRAGRRMRSSAEARFPRSWVSTSVPLPEPAIPPGRPMRSPRALRAAERPATRSPGHQEGPDLRRPVVRQARQSASGERSGYPAPRMAPMSSRS
jgi:hypothetical protein